jgi:hypothetical protein
MLAVEEVGLAADWHPGPCRRPCGGAHRSHTFTVAGRRVWATYDGVWRVRVHRTGGGRMSRSDAAHLLAVVEYLCDPAVRRS